MLFVACVRKKHRYSIEYDTRCFSKYHSIRVLVELKHLPLPLPFAFPLAALTSTGALHARGSLSIGRLQQFKFCRRRSQFISLQAICVFQVRVSHNFDATR